MAEAGLRHEGTRTRGGQTGPRDRGQRERGRRELKGSLRVFVGLPFLGTGALCESFLPKAIGCIEAQKTTAEVLAPWVHRRAISPGADVRCQVGKKMNGIMDKGLENNCTHVWCVDTDAEFGPDSLDKLLRLNVDIASAISPTHSDWNELTAACELPGGGLQFYRRMDLEGRVVGESEVVISGGFCMLIKRRALLRYSPHHAPLRYQTEKTAKSIYGPEIQFFIDAQKMGFSVRVHGDVICGHLPEWPLSYQGHPDTLFEKIRGIEWRKEA